MPQVSRPIPVLHIDVSLFNCRQRILSSAYCSHCCSCLKSLAQSQARTLTCHSSTVDNISCLQSIVPTVVAASSLSPNPRPTLFNGRQCILSSAYCSNRCSCLKSLAQSQARTLTCHSSTVDNVSSLQHIVPTVVAPSSLSPNPHPAH